MARTSKQKVSGNMGNNSSVALTRSKSGKAVPVRGLAKGRAPANPSKAPKRKTPNRPGRNWVKGA